MARQDDTNALRKSGASKPQTASRGAGDQRAERLAAALRENLLKRKAQARGRRAESGDAPARSDDSNTQAR